MTEQHGPWQDQVKQTLDERARDLDGATLAALNRARQNALDEVRHAPSAKWLPAGLIAATAVLMLAAGLGLRAPGPDMETPAAPEVALLTSDESMEMLAELEFYLWLDEALADAG